MLTAVDVPPPTSSIPSWILWGVANVAEWTCNILRCQPIVDRQQLVLTSQEMTVSDSLARKEIGYTNVITFEDGIKDLKLRHLQQIKQNENNNDKQEL